MIKELLSTDCLVLASFKQQNCLDLAECPSNKDQDSSVLPMLPNVLVCALRACPHLRSYCWFE